MAQKLQPQPQKLIGFAPDLDPSTPGIFQACTNVIPTLIGFKAAATPLNAGLATLATPVHGSALIARLDGTAREFAGTATHMYENVSGTWVDQSKAGGYSLGTSSTWRFAGFGNESLAVNGADPLQAALDGTFTNVPVALASLTITGVGAGFTSAPTVTISAPDITGSVQATATATLNGSTLGALSFTNIGSGYTKNPTVTISGGGATTAATATAQIVEAPIGNIIFVANGQVFVCNCSYPPQVAGGDFWFASGIYDQTAWDPSNQQTLCSFGQLIDTPGGITAGTSLGPNAILFKSNSMFFGTQTGYPLGWDFQAISKSIGVTCQEAIVNTGSSLFFIGTDDFYAYQGNGLPVPIGQNVRRWFFNTLNPNFKTVMSSFYDQEQHVIYWSFVSNNSLDGKIDTCLTYNWTTQTWGRMDLTMEGFVQVLSGQITYNGVGATWATYNNLPDISYNSPFWINYRVTPGFFDETNTLMTLAGSSTGGSITTNAFGDDLFYSTMQQFKMRFYAEPTSGTAIWQGRPTLGSNDPTIIDNQVTGPLVNNDARIDVDRNARWHNLILTFNGNFELLQWYPILVQNGTN